MREHARHERMFKNIFSQRRWLTRVQLCDSVDHRAIRAHPAAIRPSFGWRGRISRVLSSGERARAPSRVVVWQLVPQLVSQSLIQLELRGPLVLAPSAAPWPAGQGVPGSWFTIDLGSLRSGHIMSLQNLIWTIMHRGPVPDRGPEIMGANFASQVPAALGRGMGGCQYNSAPLIGPARGVWLRFRLPEPARETSRCRQALHSPNARRNKLWPGQRSGWSTA